MASDSGSRIIDHSVSGSSGGLDTLCTGPKGSVKRCRRAAEHLRSNGTFLAPTLIAYALLKRNTLPRAQPVAARLLAVARKLWAKSAVSGNWLRDTSVDTTNPDAAWPIADDIVPTDSFGILRIAQRVGLPILAGTDAPLGSEGNKLTPPGFTLHAELAVYVAEGLTPLRALQTATLNPAELIHGTDSLGTVAVGKPTDLVLLDANPLDDITNTTTIRAVVANGRYFDRAALDSLLAEVRTNGPAYNASQWNN